MAFSFGSDTRPISVRLTEDGIMRRAPHEIYSLPQGEVPANTLKSPGPVPAGNRETPA